jgi:hypothetical protein
MLSACAMKRQYTRNGWTPTVQLLCPPHLLEASMAPYEVAGEHSFCHWLYVKPETLKYHVEYLRSYEHKWGNNLIQFKKITGSHNKLSAPPNLSSHPFFIYISNHRCEWLRSFRSTRAVGDAPISSRGNSLPSQHYTCLRNRNYMKIWWFALGTEKVWCIMLPRLRNPHNLIFYALS